MRVAVLFNPISGAGRAAVAADAIAAALQAAGIEARKVETRRAPAADWLSPELEGASSVVVVGGDGAVRLVAAQAARSAIPLWHAPLGTENLFARAFGMDASAGHIVRAVAAGRVRRIDLARAEGVGDFAIMAGLGFDAEVVHGLSRVRSGGISRLSYARPIIESLRACPLPEVDWVIDGERERLGRGTVVVGNLSEYGARLDPARDARPDDGLLDAVFLPAEGAADMLLWVSLLRMGVQSLHPGLRMRQGASVRVELDRPTRVQLDGDPAGPAEGVRTAVFGVQPSVLPILLPDRA